VTPALAAAHASEASAEPVRMSNPRGHKAPGGRRPARLRRAFASAVAAAVLWSAIAPPLVRAARPPAAEAILAYRPVRIGPKVRDFLLANPIMARARLRALMVLALLRLARVVVASHARPGGVRAQPDGQELEDSEQALAVLDSSQLLDLGLEVGEFMAVWSFGSAQHALLAKKFPATTMSRALLVKFWSYAPALVAWSISNQLYKDFQAGKFPRELSPAVVLDLGRRVGGELLGMAIGALVIRAVVVPAAWLGRLLLPRVAALLGMEVTAASAAIKLLAGRVLSFVSVVGWILIAVMILTPIVEKGKERWSVWRVRDGTGRRIAHLSYLQDLLLSDEPIGGQPPGSLIDPDDAVRLINAYALRDAAAPGARVSKKDLLHELALTNNHEVEKLARAMKALLLEEADGKISARGRRRLAAIPGEVRALFEARAAGAFSLSAAPIVGEREVVAAELARLAGVERQDGNRIVLPERMRTLVDRTGKLAERLAGGPDRALLGPNALAIAANVHGDFETGMVDLKEYLTARLEQIKGMVEGLPRKEDALAERALVELGVQATGDLTGVRPGPGATPDFGDLSNR
jgi:hypothetical protein